MQPHDTQVPPEGQGFYRPASPSQYNESFQQDGGLPEAPGYDEDKVVVWEASEYIHRSKDAVWIVGYVIVVLAILGVALWAQEWTFAALILVMAGAMGYFAFRPPRTKHYELTHQSLKVDDRMYYLEDYRAFGVLAEDAFYSAMLIPTARFKPAVTMYFGHDDGEQIVDILGAHLPMEDIEPDIIDKIMHRLHF